MKFVLATNNEKKLLELRAILNSLDIEVVTLKQAGVNVSPEETGESFKENALIKARAALSASGLPAIADDSGLEVFALGGKPGVFSARYGAPRVKTDTGRCRKLQSDLKLIPQGMRGARFVCEAACVFPGGKEVTARGELDGEILFHMKGTGGFGYDPLFYIPEFKMTMAQMPAELKNSISHRTKALNALCKEISSSIF